MKCRTERVMPTLPQNIVDAYMCVAMCNHYLVMVDPEIRLEDMQHAEQLLIRLENDTTGLMHTVVERALDQLQADMKAD